MHVTHKEKKITQDKLTILHKRIMIAGIIGDQNTTEHVEIWET